MTVESFDTIGRAMRSGIYFILCFVLTLGGCSSAPKYGAPVSTLAGNDVQSANNARSQPDVAHEDGEEIDGSIVESTEPNGMDARIEQATNTAARNIPVDPGASWLVGQLKQVLDAEGERESRSGQVYISARSIRNQSRAQSDEFDAMVDRLARLLDAAGADDRLRFTADPAVVVNYHLKGTAYLVTAEGFDLWELYLSLKPSDRAWTMWQADAPLRLLRSARLRGQQLFPPVSSVR